MPHIASRLQSVDNQYLLTCLSKPYHFWVINLWFAIDKLVIYD